MKKFCLSLLLLLFIPSITFADTLFTSVNNVPIQESNTSPRVIWFLPKNAKVEIISKNGEGYNVKCEGISGWIYAKHLTKNSEQLNIPTEQSNLTQDEKMKLIISCANKYGHDLGIDPNLVLAIIYTESGFNPNAVSNANCLGLMQVSSYYAPSLGIDPNRLFEIEYNIYHGTRIFATKSLPGTADIQDGNTNIFHALRAYNCGVSGAHWNNYQTSVGYANKVLSQYDYYKSINFAGSI